MRYQIFVVKNGYLLNIYKGKSSESWVYKEHERMTMFAHIMKAMGPEPDDAVGKELETKN